MKPRSSLFILYGAIILATGSANAADIYANNISALNINMLTDVFMSYTNNDETMSSLFNRKKIYGTMNRFDEYGDDGSTIQSTDIPSSDRYFINNFWINAGHINESMHFGQNVSQRGRFYLASVGGATQASDLKYGKLSFGGFVSYINAKMPDFRGGGDAIGLFANYKYRNFGAKVLTDIGSLNNGMDGMNFNNSWVNAATAVSGTFKIDNTFLVRPDIYVAYTYVSADDLYIGGNTISSKDYNFFNVAPALSFIKEISPNWYGKMSAKYVAHFGGKNDIKIDDAAIRGLYLDNHTDLGIDVEHNYKHFVFGGNVHKQVGGLDGWSGNINVKYVF